MFLITRFAAYVRLFIITSLLCFGASFEYLCEVTALPLLLLWLFILSFCAAAVVVVNILLSLVSV